MNYYLKLGEQVNGPYHRETLQKFLADGMLSGEHLISTDQTNWLPLNSQIAWRNPTLHNSPTPSEMPGRPPAPKASFAAPRVCGIILVLIGVLMLIMAVQSDFGYRRWHTAFLGIGYGAYAAITGKWWFN